jgi:hypothetical protein
MVNQAVLIRLRGEASQRTFDGSQLDDIREPRFSVRLCGVPMTLLSTRTRNESPSTIAKPAGKPVPFVAIGDGEIADICCAM